MIMTMTLIVLNDFIREYIEKSQMVDIITI